MVHVKSKAFCYCWWQQADLCIGHWKSRLHSCKCNHTQYRSEGCNSPTAQSNSNPTLLYPVMYFWVSFLCVFHFPTLHCPGLSWVAVAFVCKCMFHEFSHFTTCILVYHWTFSVMIREYVYFPFAFTYHNLHIGLFLIASKDKSFCILLHIINKVSLNFLLYM